MIKLTLKSCVIGFALGIIFALLIAMAFSYVDWWRNPSGIFHDETSTNWSPVTDTLVSWFWPLLLLCGPLSILGHVWFSRRRSTS
jgi:CDP-diglyceride synthetase